MSCRNWKRCHRQGDIQSWLFSKPSMTVISLNIEGLSAAKEDLIAKMCFKHKCSVLCLQETHRGPQSHRPKVNGMTCIVALPHDKYGSTIFVKEGTTVKSIHTDDQNNIETLSVDLGRIVITSVYKPPAAPFKLPPLLQPHKNRIVIRDFNSNNIQWGYNSTNEDGNAVEQWSDSNQLSLVHDAKHPPSFNSARWKAGYNPDIAFVNQTIGSLCKKGVLDPIPRTQHRPIIVNVHAAVTPTIVPYQRRFNFQKADWISSTNDLENQIYNIIPNPKNYKIFTNLVQNIARKHIPRGCRTRYVPCLNKESLNMLYKHKMLYKKTLLLKRALLQENNSCPP